MALTITEALAEIKTIGKRAEKKREFVRQYLARQDGIKDPLAQQGGSYKAIETERQSIQDLENRIVTLRRAIQVANQNTTVNILGQERSLADWLVWRREAAPLQQAFLGTLRTSLATVRTQAQRAGNAVVQAVATTGEVKATDIVVNIDEQALAQDIERLEETLGTLDGVLSLKNATVVIDA